MPFDAKKWAGNKMGAPAGPKPPFGGPQAPPGPPRPPMPPAPGAAPPGAPGAAPGAGPPLFNPAITSQHLPPDQAKWTSVTNEPERPDNPPAWVDDEAAWEKAKEAVRKNWGDYDDPWAVVATVYKNMAG